MKEIDEFDEIDLCPGNARYRIGKARNARKLTRAFTSQHHTWRWRRELMPFSPAKIRKSIHDQNSR